METVSKNIDGGGKEGRNGVSSVDSGGERLLALPPAVIGGGPALQRHPRFLARHYSSSAYPPIPRRKSVNLGGDMHGTTRFT